MLWHRAISIFKKNPTLYIALGLMLLSLVFYLPSLNTEARLSEQKVEWEQQHQQHLEKREMKQHERDSLYKQQETILEDTQTWMRRADELESYLKDAEEDTENEEKETQ